MIIEIQYKSTFIKIVLENEFSIKVENLKTSLKASLLKELENLEKNLSKNPKSTTINIQNKNISNNSIIKPVVQAHKFSLNSVSKEDIRDLVLDTDKYFWRLFEINSKTQVPIEKKDEDYIKLSETNKGEKKLIKLLISRSYKVQVPKTNFKKLPKEDPSELIRIMTGAKDKVKLEDKSKNKKLNYLLDNNSDDIFQRLIGLNNNSSDTRVAFLQDLLGVRAGQIQNTSSSNSEMENNSRVNFQNRIFQSIFNVGLSRPFANRPVSTVVPNPDKLQQLLEMGFSEERSRRALTMTRNNLEAAVELIANDQDLAYDQPNDSFNNSNNVNDQDLSIDDLEDEDI
jgi:hypothetical protein